MSGNVAVPLDVMLSSDEIINLLKSPVKLPNIKQDALAELIFTFGTTGTSKGVVYEWGVRKYGFVDDSTLLFVSFFAYMQKLK